MEGKRGGDEERHAQHASSATHRFRALATRGNEWVGARGKEEWKEEGSNLRCFETMDRRWGALGSSNAAIDAAL